MRRWATFAFARFVTEPVSEKNVLILYFQLLKSHPKLDDRVWHVHVYIYIYMHAVLRPQFVSPRNESSIWALLCRWGWHAVVEASHGCMTRGSFWGNKFQFPQVDGLCIWSVSSVDLFLFFMGCLPHMQPPMEKPNYSWYCMCCLLHLWC